MDQLENNLNIESEIAIQVELEFVKLASVGIHSNAPDVTLWTMHGPLTQKLGPSSADLELRFFVDQMDQRPLPILCGELENKISRFISKVDGSFIGRDVHLWHNGTTVLDYKLKLHHYENFLETLKKVYKKRLDAEFTKALESKLSED